MRKNENSISNYEVEDTCTFIVEKKPKQFISIQLSAGHVNYQKMKHVASFVWGTHLIGIIIPSGCISYYSVSLTVQKVISW